MSQSRKPRIRLRGSRIAPIGAAVGVAVGGAVNSQTPPVAVDDEFEVVKRDVWQVAGNMFDNDTAVNPVLRSISQLDVWDGSYGFSSSGDVTFRGLLAGRCAATSDRFEYEMEDDSGINVTAEVQVSLLPPVQSDTYQVQAGETLAEDVQANDPMPINPINVVDQLNVTDFLAPGFGTVNQSNPGVVNQTGQFTYQPDPGFSGNDSFVYLTADPDTGCDWNTEVNVLVLPTAVSDTTSTPGGQEVCNIDVLGNDLGSGLSLVNVVQPANGTVSVSGDDTLCFTPDLAFLGLATFGYTIEDANGSQVDGVVEVDVFNLPPAPVDDNYTVSAGQSLDGNVLDNDADPNSDSLSASLATPPAHGALVLNPDGSFTYTPAMGFSGADSFAYTASDGNGGSETAEVVIDVRPVAVADAVSTPGGEQLCDIDVLSNDLGTDLDVVGVTQPANGTVSVSGDDTLCFSPDQGFLGQASFAYTIEDGTGSQASANVEVDVFNLPPVLVDDSYQLPAGQALSGNVLDNDSDLNGDSLSVAVAMPPANGDVVLDPDGSFTYTPEAGFSGSDAFSYSATESRGDDSTADVSILVVPVVADTVVQGSTEREVSGNLLDGSLGSGLTVIDWTEPPVGTLTVNPDGSYTYVAPPGYRGTIEFPFTAEDESGSEARGSVTLGFALELAVPGPGGGALGLLAILLGWLGFRRLR
ncbi:Ig-like domain-containing protein [Wenzhouxiangella sp. EGI_FJ10305]|uniref:Ig-like domain-containing protein n=1 Tax=Wenzhouxiangella sp. EGI_FJ10305 TaxID=3243768 RepID=UPI0035E13397